MISERDGRVRVLPLHVANKIAAGEVVERPASVVKELLENSIDAGARKIAISIDQGGRKLIAVQDDGCGMTREDATLSLERQATSKIRDVDDIENIDTLGFRGEAIPSIASVSRFTLATRRRESDEGTLLQVDAGNLTGVRACGCPPGTRVEVRDLFCNVPARRKFLRSIATEENHIKTVFTIHALSHPDIAFSLTVDGHERYRLAPAASAEERVRELFGADTAHALLPVMREDGTGGISVTGFIERPHQATPTRRDQYIFVNGRPATTPSIAAALREACPHRQGDVRPAAVLFITLPPGQVDVNVHPTKREVRFRDNAAVKRALIEAIGNALSLRPGHASPVPVEEQIPATPAPSPLARPEDAAFLARTQPQIPAKPSPKPPQPIAVATGHVSPPTPAPVETELDLPAADTNHTKPWAWFKFLATTESGYLLIETDAGVVTLNPHAARERIAFEQLKGECVSQALLIPDTVQLPPPDFARIAAARAEIEAMGFRLEPFGRDTFKIEAIPQLTEGLKPATVLSTIARDLADAAGRSGGSRWRDEIIARSVARSFAGMSLALTEEGAVKLVEELAACNMPYVCPRGKPIMIFTSTRELDRKFSRE